jgi:NAD(P)-dependent dehydrogenase (short-subunit alcohol dehydrogenase family)
MTLTPDGSAGSGRPGGALVTGGARGLGLEIGRRLSARGYAVHVTDLYRSRAERAAAELGGRAFGSALDVRSFSACRAAAAGTMRHAGSLEVWVNNAGVLVPGPAWEQDEHTRALMLDVNAVGTINGTLAALEPMRAAGRGTILNVISMAGLIAVPGQAIYSASKHAAIGFSLATLADLRLAGITGIEICCACPDTIWTPMIESKLSDPTAAASFAGVMMRPARVAGRIVTLIDRPRPVLTIPRWRGALVRVSESFPRLTLRSLGPVMALARAQQRRLRERRRG